MVQGRLSNAALRKNESLILAQKARLTARASMAPTTPHQNETENQGADKKTPGDEVECTGWSGGVTYHM